MVIYDIDRRIEILEEILPECIDRHERHFYESRLEYLENLRRR